MLVLAAIPSASVALVVARSATLGIANGISAALGIVVGDLVFVSLAILGMGILAETMGAFFSILKFIGAAYLIAIGFALLRSKNDLSPQERVSSKRSLAASFASGLLLTLGDVKAILFYASLFPAFVDMASLNGTDIAGIVIVTAIAVGSVKISYALAARKIAQRLSRHRARKLIRPAAGCCMIGAGAYVISKT